MTSCYTWPGLGQIVPYLAQHSARAGPRRWSPFRLHHPTRALSPQESGQAKRL